MHSGMDNRTSAAGLPHSEIPRSTPGYRLPWAYRRFPRPSSPSDAKTSTTCPCWLDHVDLGPTHSPAAAASPAGQRYKPGNPLRTQPRSQKPLPDRTGQAPQDTTFFSMNHEQKKQDSLHIHLSKNLYVHRPGPASSVSPSPSSGALPARSARMHRAEQYSPSHAAVKFQSCTGVGGESGPGAPVDRRDAGQPVATASYRADR